VIAIAELIALKTMRSFKSSLVCCLKTGIELEAEARL
jgi:hypothetical protein